MISLVFNQVLYISFLGTIAALIILAAKAITKDTLGIKFQYAVDFILIIRLLLCVGVATSISIYNYVPSYSSTMMNIPSVIKNNVNTSDAINAKEIAGESITTTILGRGIVSDLFFLAEIIWITGMIVIVSAIVISCIKAIRNINRSNLIEEKKIIKIFEECRKKAGVINKIKLIESDIVKSPCVYGFINPKILIPNSLLKCTDNIDFRYIFLHELVHVKKHHILINYIIFMLSTIHWFNPV